jgi:hypothetical protein
VQATLTVNYDTYAVVPEPSTGLLAGLGAVLLSAARKSGRGHFAQRSLLG